MSTRQLTNPVINLLINNARDGAPIHRSSILRLKRRAILVARTIKRTLKRIALPAKEVVAVIGVASPIRHASALYPIPTSFQVVTGGEVGDGGREIEDLPITKTPHKRLTPVLRPILPVIKQTRIPDNLVEQLSHAYGVRSWARAAGFKGAVFGVRHVCHVVWGVEVDAVPAAVVCQ
jgi:hypothetical protein